MATTPTGIVAGARGIAITLDNYVILSYDIDEKPIYQQYPDQVGAIADETKYDTRYDLTMQCYSKTFATTAPTIGTGQVFVFNAKNWKLDSLKEAGVYNDTLKFTITAHRFENSPAQT